jgi:hypothetical protein
MTDSPKPVRTVRHGTIQAAIWRNSNDKNEVYYGVTFERLFRPQGQQWRSSQTFGRGDLLLLAKVADEAHTAIGEICEADKASKSPNAPAAAASSARRGSSSGPRPSR